MQFSGSNQVFITNKWLNEFQRLLLTYIQTLGKNTDLTKTVQNAVLLISSVTSLYITALKEKSCAISLNLSSLNCQDHENNIHIFKYSATIILRSNDKTALVCLRTTTWTEKHMKAFLIVTKWSHKSFSTHTFRPSAYWQSAQPIIAHEGNACHHRDRQHGRQSTTAQLGPLPYRQPVITDGWNWIYFPLQIRRFSTLFNMFPAASWLWWVTRWPFPCS